MQKNPKYEIGKKGHHCTHSYEKPPSPGLSQMEKNPDQKEGCHYESKGFQKDAVGEERGESENHAPRMGLLKFPNSPALIDENDGESAENQAYTKGKEPRPWLHEGSELDPEGFPYDQQRQ